MAKGYVLAALDMDGTLLNTYHEVTSHTREVLERAVREGCLIALSTGRCMSELKRYLDAVPAIGYVIGESGGWIYDVRKDLILRHIALDDTEVDFMLNAAEGMDITWQAFVDNQSYIQFGRRRDWSHYRLGGFAEVFEMGSLFVDDVARLCRAHPGKVEKINFFFSDEAECRRFGEFIAERPLAVTGSIAIGYEVSPTHVSKAQGLRLLCDYLGLSMEQTMAVGDGGNDLDIMAAAGLAVAMGNAIREVRDVADVITDDNDHDGVAHAIEKYMLLSK